jgi:hypothetical protein
MKKTLLAGLLFIGTLAHAQKSGLIHADNAQLRKVGSFTAINVSNAIDLYLTQSGSNEVAVSASTEEYRDKIITEVEGGTLIIKMDHNNGWFNWKYWGNTKAKVYVSVKDIDAITASGATNVRIITKVESPKLKIKLSGASDFKGVLEVGALNLQVSGASDFKGRIEAKSLVLDASGASTVELDGNVEDLSADVSGASNAKLQDLKAKGGTVQTSGASTAKVNVSQLLKLDASGASTIHYYGAPNRKEIKNTGSSTIRQHND